MSKSLIWSLAGLGVVVVAIILILVFVPANNNNKTNNTSSNLQQTQAAQKLANENAIKHNFATFFAVNTSMQERQNLLQNGSQFAQPMQAEFAQLVNQKPSVSISSVTLEGNTTAKVVYTVDLNNQPVLQNQSGEAVLVGGLWKVSDSTLCQLFSLGGTTPAACKNL